MFITRVEVHGKYKYYKWDGDSKYYISEYSKKKKKYEWYETIIAISRQSKMEVVDDHKLLEILNGNK